MYFFLFWPPCSIWCSQARNPSHSYGGNNGSLTHCAGPGIQPASQHSQDTTSLIVPQWELPVVFVFYDFVKFSRRTCQLFCRPTLGMSSQG